MVGTTGATGGEGAISAVREGMRVVDAEGEDVGTVAEVRMSDPGSVTAQGQGGSGERGLVGAVVDVVTGADELPQHEQERLARLGFVRIDARGLFAGDRYAAGDQIAGVTGESVQLTVSGSMLVG